MKARITFKNPQVAPDLFLAIATNGKEDGKSAEKIHEEIIKGRKILKNFVSYNEYITVEIDTQEGTCSVIKV